MGREYNVTTFEGGKYSLRVFDLLTVFARTVDSGVPHYAITFDDDNRHWILKGAGIPSV